MIKSIAAIGVLAVAGTAVAGPFSVAGVRVGVSGANFADPSAGLFPLSGALGGGVVWNNTFVTGDLAGQGNVIGAHPGAFPAGSEAAASASGAQLVVDADPFSGGADDAWNVGFGLQNAAEYVASAAGALGENDVWVARIQGDNLDLFQLEVIFSDAPAVNVPFVLDGDGVQAEGSTLFAKSVPFDGGFDIIITDVPAPGAAALLGLAGVAGLRRRRA